jgi:hypothetical protein
MLKTALVIMWFVSAEQFTTDSVSQMCSSEMWQYRFNNDAVKVALTVWWWDFPVIAEWSAPCEPQNLHNNETESHVA